LGEQRRHADCKSTWQPTFLVGGLIQMLTESFDMTPQKAELTRLGKIKYGLAAWLLGLPLPIIIIALLWGGCTNW
jgi:hypothetical protein